MTDIYGSDYKTENVTPTLCIFQCKECISFLFGKYISEVIFMSKKGMKRPQVTHTEERNTVPPVPEIQGKAKSGKDKANPIIAGTHGATQKFYHSTTYSQEEPISKAYPVIDTDLGRDNAENDLTAADLQDN